MGEEGLLHCGTFGAVVTPLVFPNGTIDTNVH